MSALVLDLFAGPGGWSVGAERLGLPEVGVEWDRAACETAWAAGFHRDPMDVRDLDIDPGQFGGLIASPPCQTFSAAGKGAGRAALSSLCEAVEWVSFGVSVGDALAVVHNPDLDERSALVLEPMRLIAQGRPEWIAMEQVPGVLPVWEAYAKALRAGFGYHVDTGLLHAEQFGVPQTRTRAFLVARQDREVHLPVPTHSRYYPRNPSKLDPGVRPWVSMADALDATTAMRSNYGTGGDPAARGVREPWEPAPTVTSKIGRNKWVPVHAVDGDETPLTWTGERPSPTIVSSFAPDVVAAPGYRKAGDGPRQKTPGSVRVTVAEAAVLQPFPPDHPWQGSKTAQYRQVGDAVPPLLAEAVLSVVAYR